MNNFNIENQRSVNAIQPGKSPSEYRCTGNRRTRWQRRVGPRHPWRTADSNHDDSIADGRAGGRGVPADRLGTMAVPPSSSRGERPGCQYPRFRRGCPRLLAFSARKSRLASAGNHSRRNLLRWRKWSAVSERRQAACCCRLKACKRGWRQVKQIAEVAPMFAEYRASVSGCVVVWVLASSASLTIPVFAIELHADFDHASLDVANSSTIGANVQLVGRDNHNPGNWKWLYFSAIDVLGQTPTFVIGDNFETGSSSLLGHKMVYSYDQQTWHFFENNVLDTASDAFTFWNDSPYTEPEVFVAYGLPYPLERVASHTSGIATSPWVSPTNYSRRVPSCCVLAGGHGRLGAEHCSARPARLPNIRPTRICRQVEGGTCRGGACKRDTWQFCVGGTGRFLGGYSSGGGIAPQVR